MIISGNYYDIDIDCVKSTRYLTNIIAVYVKEDCGRTRYIVGDRVDYKEFVKELEQWKIKSLNTI